MNIFVSDLSPIIAAQNLDDKRVKHMPKECIELLIMSVHKTTNEVIHAPFIIWNREYRAKQGKFTELYNNRCTEWVGRKKENAYWLLRHTNALFDEHKYRFSKEHYLTDLLNSIIHYIPISINEPKSFVNASGMVGTNIVENYRKGLIYKWTETDEIRPCVWTRRGSPSWFKNSQVTNGELFPVVSEVDSQEFEDLPF